ncbi:MAG: hypothetical protein RR091_05030 [Cloacibacillus sp.]
MTQKEFFQAVKAAGGRAYLVGGAVRDGLMGRFVHDRDYVICGLSLDRFLKIFPDARPVSHSFPVFLLSIDGALCEVAFARKEKKNGTGYKGFNFVCDAAITIEEDLRRRDTTINSIALDDRGTLIDPFGGERDIAEKTIRAVSSHFFEDPVRALRAARQAAQLGFEIEPRTLAMMNKCAAELALEPKERKFAELKKALACERPSVYFRALRAAGLLSSEFPWLFGLIGNSKPNLCRPESDAFERSMEGLDRAAADTTRLEVRFAALVHELPHHFCQESVRLEVLPKIDKALGLPKKWRQCAAFVIKEETRAPHLTNAATIRDLLRAAQASPLGIDGLCAVVAAYNETLPAYLRENGACIRVMDEAAKEGLFENLKGPQIGAHIRAKETAALAKYLEAAEDHAATI